MNFLKKRFMIKLNNLLFGDTKNERMYRMWKETWDY